MKISKQEAKTIIELGDISYSDGFAGKQGWILMQRVFKEYPDLKHGKEWLVDGK